MIVYNNKEYRNLQQQVKENMDDIKQLQNISTAGIKVDYIVSAAEDLADIEDPEAGQMAAVGTEVPYTIYTYYDNAWVNFGEFPMPGPEGPQGPQGERGPQGATGAQGPQGPRGFTGAQGNTGPKGDKGDTGAAGRDGTDGISPVITMQSPSVTTLEPGESATATVIVGGTTSEPTYKFEFGIPRGQDGSVAGTLPWGALTGDLSSQADLMSKFSEYALLSDIPTKTSQLQNDDGFITSSALAGYATQSWVGSQGYLTSIPSEYATISQVSSAISALDYASVGALSSATVIPDITGLASEGYVNASIAALSSIYADINSLSNYATVSSLSSYATISSLSVYATIDSLSEYATVSAMSSAIDGVNSTISSLNYASVHALSEDTVIPDITGLASEGYVNSAISALDYASVGALSAATVIPDITGLASETYVNNSIAALSSVYAPVGDYATNSALSSAISSLSSIYASQAELSNYALLGDIPVISGTHDVSNWTTITINNDTYSIPAGGSVPSGVYAELSANNSFTGTNTFTNTTRFNATAPVYFSGTVRLNGNTYLSNNYIYANSIKFSFPASSGTLALKSEIPSTSDFATISALSSAIDGLSSVYAPLSAIPSMSLYAELSASNTFTGTNTFSNSLYASQITLAEDSLTSTGCYLSGTASGMNSCSIRLLAGYGDMASAATAGIGLTVSPLGTVVSLHANQINLGYPSAIYISGSPITDAFYYKDGDKYQNTSYQQIFGYITAASKNVQITITLPKSLKNISSVTVNKASLVVRGVGGYVGGSAYIDYVTAADSTITADISSENTIYITISKTAAWSGATNNTPITAVTNNAIGSLELTFNS